METGHRNINRFLGAALAGILAGSAASMAATKATDPNGIIRCYGINDCKAKTACDTALNTCAGKNECKGKGFLEVSRKECKKRKGKTKDPFAKTAAKKT